MAETNVVTACSAFGVLVAPTVLDMMISTLLLLSRGLGPDFLFQTWRLVTVCQLYLLETKLETNLILSTLLQWKCASMKAYAPPPFLCPIAVQLKWTASRSINPSFMPMQLQAFSKPSTCTTQTENDKVSWSNSKIGLEDHRHLSLECLCLECLCI